MGAKLRELRQSDLDLSYEVANGTRISLRHVLDDLEADEVLLFLARVGMNRDAARATG